MGLFGHLSNNDAIERLSQVGGPGKRMEFPTTDDALDLMRFDEAKSVVGIDLAAADTDAVTAADAVERPQIAHRS
ncbi:MAG: hypothetical protein RIK87_07440 [Fuerstiella sp.]